MPATSLEALSREALAALARDCGAAEERLWAALGRRAVVLRAGAEEACLDGSRRGVSAPPAAPDVVVEAASRCVLVDLVEGLNTLENALMTGSVDARGDVADLLAAHEALRWLVVGLARCPSAEGLLARLAGDEGDHE